MRENPARPPLTILDVPAPTLPEPPRILGEPGLMLWRSIQSEFRVVDVGGVQLLLQACLASDRAEALRARIDTDGETITTQTGMRAHPCLKDELAARAFICRILRQLGVTDEPVKAVGRPPGPRWRGRHGDE
jgi:hypothetical protein